MPLYFLSDCDPICEECQSDERGCVKCPEGYYVLNHNCIGMSSRSSEPEKSYLLLIFDQWSRIINYDAYTWHKTSDGGLLSHYLLVFPRAECEISMPSCLTCYDYKNCTECDKGYYVDSNGLCSRKNKCDIRVSNTILKVN